MTSTTENHIGGGKFHGPVVQARNVSLAQPDRPDPALIGLPQQSRTFAGRQGQLDQIHRALDPAAPNKGSGTVVVTGLAGMGKTELIIQAAHRVLREEEWFPGGVLFIDLHGYDTEERRVSPKRALGSLLRALGIPPEHIPPGVEDRSRIYRSELGKLAAAGRRVLVVLDDAPATGCIRHLLPSGDGAATLVSSRHSLTELDALALTLQELSADGGRKLLSGALHAADPRDSRVEVEADEADRLVTLCGGLPLALRILASLLIDVPTRPLSCLRRDLEDAHSALSVLSREKRAVDAAFELSYRKLTEDQAELFRLISLQPGPDFSTESTAHLYEKSFDETQRVLLDLARRHLVEPREPYGRWQQHNLVRLYSRQQLASADDSWTFGLMRLFAHFHEMTTLACARLFDPLAQHHPAETPFTDRAAALAWLDAERHSLVAATIWAHEDDKDLLCVALAVPVTGFLAEAHYLEDARRVLAAGIRSSRRRTDRYSEAALRSSLGVVLQKMRKLRKSIRAHHKAIKICRGLESHRALPGALNNLGLALHHQRKFEEAAAAHAEAAQLFKDADDRMGLAHALSNTGETLVAMGRTERASRALRKAAKIYRKQGDLLGYARALDGLARATLDEETATQAAELRKRSLSMADALLPHERAIELTNFATTLTANREFDAALTAQQEALGTFRQLGNRHREAATLGQMALVRQNQGKWGKAVRLHTLALEAFLESNDDHALASELTQLASALLQQGCNIEALENLELAADLYHRADEPESAADTLDLAAQVRRRVGVGLRPAESQA